jgi:cytochrome c peroxidase
VPPNLATFVADPNAAVRLGKALFWDMQVGSDGVQACASCHFHAGADNRKKNQVSPGVLANPRDTTFQLGGPNFTLGLGDFLPGTLQNDVVSSQGVFNRSFTGVTPGNPVDSCQVAPDPDGFRVGGINTRRVEPRNTPTVINAVFNFHNFWDGRANNSFNGVTPRGPGLEDGNSIFQEIGGVLTPVTVAITNGSLASQAVGPPRSEFEMSCAGRTFPNIGRKMLNLTPLVKQRVRPDDSVLGPVANTLINPLLKGLSVTYSQMIQQAFVNTWWNSALTVTIGSDTFTQMEANFPLFFGLAVQLYQATLISDDTPFDRFADPVNPVPTALNAAQQRGLLVFNGLGRCNQCHIGPLISDATNADPAAAFRNIGVRANSEDLGAGPIFGIPGDATFEGRFKIAQLRNVELTGPYFHNGGKATLRQVIEFYDEGGDSPLQLNHDPNVQPLGLSQLNKDDLVEFFRALTDERVRFRSAPFDHPSLCIPDGHPGDNLIVVESAPGSGEAADSLRCISATGANGSATPLRAFESLPLFGDTTFATNFIEEMASAGITAGCIPGRPGIPGSYCPDNPVTRGQMAVFIEAALGNPANACAGLFPDVDVANPFCGFIERLAQDGITGGCGAGNYCPNDPVSRGQMAVFIEAALGNPGNACAVQFTDVDAANPFCGFIERLAQDGITGGCGGGNFCPNDPVTRGQMAVFVASAFLF